MGRPKDGNPLGGYARVTFMAGGVQVEMAAARTLAFGHGGVAFAFGLAVSLVVAASGHLGGAHINPAVTIGFWTVRRFPTPGLLPYVVAQCLGAIAASLLLVWLLGPVGDAGATVPPVSIARAFVIEAGYTGVLGFVITAVATDDRVPAATVPFVLGTRPCGPRACRPSRRAA